MIQWLKFPCLAFYNSSFYRRMDIKKKENQTGFHFSVSICTRKGHIYPQSPKGDRWAQMFICGLN